MTVIQSEIKRINLTLNSTRSLRTKFYYPKIVLFEDPRCFRITDLETKAGTTASEDQIFNINEEITDSALQEHLLWLMLESGEILVTDLLTGLQIKLTVSNYSKLKFFQVNESTFVFKSDSGEELINPITTKELTVHINDCCKELTVSLKKRNKDEIVNFGDTHNGFSIYLEDGNLICQCPITKQKELLTSNTRLEYIQSWGEYLILADISKIWIMDLESSSIVYIFDNFTRCAPVVVYKNVFYYLAEKDNEVVVACGRISTAFNREDEGEDSINISQKVSSQESLMAELKLLLESILAGKEDKSFSHLQSFFENIEDFSFLIETAVKLYQHSAYNKSLLYTIQKRVCAKDDEQLVPRIADIIIKTDLLEYLSFRGNKTYENVNVFEKTPEELCITFISKLDFDIASMCWLKYSVLKLSITSKEVIDIMNSIPSNAKMGSIIMWLKNFVPYILEKNPFYMDLFVRWAMERIFILEQSGYWPKIGIKFIDEIIIVLESSLKLICVRPISIDDLDTLKDKINYIGELKEKYKINLLLSELSQNPNEVTLIMLRRCYTEDLEAFLQDYLPTYATRHLFDTDEVLTTFVESETASSGGVVDGNRLELILKAFRSPSNKLECLLHVLKSLEVPWSTTVIKLAINAAASASKDFTASDPDRMIAHEIQKEINCANVKVVLKKYNFPLTCTDYTLVLHKLVSGTSVDLSDLKAITTVMSNYANYGNALYINKCLEDSDCRSALEYFHNMPIKQKQILLKTVMIKYEQIVNGNINTRIVERNYIDFIKGTHMLNEIQISNIDSLYHLKNSYDIELCMNNIYREEVCANQIQNSCTSKNSSASVGIVSQLVPSQTRESSLISLLRGVSAVHKVRKTVEYMILNVQDHVEKIAKDIDEALSQFKDGTNLSLLLDVFEITIELINKCKEEHLHYLIRRVALLNALIHANITVKNLTIAWKFNYVYLPISSGNAINEFIGYSIAEITNKNDTFTKVLNKIHCDFIPFRIVTNVVVNSNHDNLLADELLLTKDDVTNRLLTKVLAAQEFDEVLTTVLLILLNNSCELNKEYYLIDILRGQGESLSPKLSNYLSNPIIRRSLSIDTNIQGSNVVYPPKYILKSKFNINFSDIALPENTEETWDVKVILFYILKQNPDTASERLSELCRALNVSTNDGLSLQLISLLTTWELRYKIFCDELGCRQIYIENDTRLLYKCLIIWENISNKDFLKDVLKDFWKNGEVTLHGRIVSVNPYYYEVFLCINRLIFGTSFDSNNIKEYYLLNYLKEYRRISLPKQYEFESFSVKGMFPEIGYYRLPFHLFMREDMWSNLKSEITLETYERWLPAVALLSLDADLQIAKDMICSNALKQTMTSRKREGDDTDSKENEPWRLASREEPLLRAAHRCVRHIANMEWAGACLFYVLQGCTRGADQVAAAHLCYQFAQRWAALQPGNRAVKQMERLHATLSTRHVLYKIEWACEEFVRLATEPAQLIRALYLHSDFVYKITRFDVNRAANEIADKNNINISSIRIQILENLLDKVSDDQKARRASLLTKELITAKYILKATCPKMGAIYLSRIAFDDDSDYNKCKKLRALQCLMSVVESDTAIKVTNKERDALWISLLELLSIVKIENIDMPWVVLTFTQDKHRALEQLLQNVNGNIEGLRITASLACQFGNYQIIRNLIPLLMRSGLNEELIPLLLKLANPPDSMIYKAWRAVILSPFQNADYPITESQKNKCLNAINLLPVCPIIKDEDLKELWKNCVRLKIYGFGCLILPYMTPQTRQSLTELQKIDRRNLIISLKNLHTDTYLVSGAMHVIEGMASRAYKH